MIRNALGKLAVASVVVWLAVGCGDNDPGEAAPAAASDSATVAEGGTVVVDVVANDTDADGDLDAATVVIVDTAVNGALTVNADGTVDYVHDGTETTSDTFTYEISDAAGNTSAAATVTITVTGVNDGPLANDDTAQVAEGASATIDLAANDTDGDDGLDLTTVTIVSNPVFGSLTINADGTVLYAHDGSKTANTDSFTYTIDDVAGLTSNEATVTITITTVDDAPVAADDSATVAEGDTVNVDLATNDTDADSSVDLTAIVIVAGATNGSVSVNANGTVDYTHDGSETVSDSFTYTIADVGGTISNTATVTITVTPVNDAPLAADDAATIDEAATQNLDLATNDTDSDDGLDLASIVVVAGATNGSVGVNVNGTVDYTHDGSETTSDSFTYTITDMGGIISNTATVTITVTPVNDAPIAVADDVVATYLRTTNLDIAANDIDVDDGLDLTTIVITTTPQEGTLQVNADGTVDYTHTGAVVATDSFAYTINDASGVTSNIVTVSLTLAMHVDDLVAGELVVTEIMQNPNVVSDNNGEWFEVYNATATAVELNGLVVSDLDVNTFTVATSVTVAAGEYALFAASGDAAINGGLPTPDYVYTGFFLGNASDEVVLSNSTIDIDVVAYDDGATFPDPLGASMQLDRFKVDTTANDSGGNWCDGAASYGDGDLGTPGGANDSCFDVSCLAIKTADAASISGIYTLDPNSNGATFDAYCDMDGDSGGWTLVARFASADTANWMLDTGEWWFDKVTESGVPTSRSENADMISAAFWTVNGAEMRLSRSDNVDDTGLLVTNAACLGDTDFRSFITSFGDFRDGAIWAADQVLGSCTATLGNNWSGTGGFSQATCANPNIGAADSISFWADWGNGDGAVMMIGGGGNNCGRADHGIGVTEANSASFNFGTQEDDFGDNGQNLSHSYALNLWVR